MIRQINQHGFTHDVKDMGKIFKEELMNVFLTGRPNKHMYRFHAQQSIQGADISECGDIITKTIRLRYHHLKGWIEEQKSLKVRA